MPNRIIKKPASIASKFRVIFSNASRKKKPIRSARLAKNPIIFLHIPKTAGTSFRVSAMEYFGPKAVLRDYGEQSKNTSSEVLIHYYANNDIDRLRIVGSNRKFITGHYPATRYKDVFPNSPIVTFLRDPVERVVSEYYHFKKDPMYKKSLKEHYRHRKNQNIQSRSLDGLSLSDISFVGLTEHYETSLQLFNQRFNTELESQEINKGHYGDNNTPVVSLDEVQEIRELNLEDVDLYLKAKERFLLKCGPGGIGG